MSAFKLSHGLRSIRYAPHTNKRIGEFLLVQSIHLHLSHIIVRGEEITHDSSRQAQAVVGVHPIILEDLLSTGVWRTDDGGGSTGNGRS